MNKLKNVGSDNVPVRVSSLEGGQYVKGASAGIEDCIYITLTRRTGGMNAINIVTGNFIGDESMVTLIPKGTEITVVAGGKL